jgi:hypothetical protein
LPKLRMGHQSRWATSACGTKPTSSAADGMSAFEGKADMPPAWCQVCFWHKADVSRARTHARAAGAVPEPADLPVMTVPGWQA